MRLNLFKLLHVRLILVFESVGAEQGKLIYVTCCWRAIFRITLVRIKNIVATVEFTGFTESLFLPFAKIDGWEQFSRRLCQLYMSCHAHAVSFVHRVIY